MKNTINVIMQGFYGNHIHTKINKNNFDKALQGIMDKSLCLDYPSDCSIVKIPDSNCVLVYNKHQEADFLKEVHRWKYEEGYRAKPLAIFPENHLEIYSRCFVCRINAKGDFTDIEPEDYDTIIRYLAE